MHSFVRSACTALLLLYSADAGAQGRPDFSGTWSFDASQTEVTGRISWPAQLVITPTPAGLRVAGSSARQVPVTASYTFDGSEVTVPAARGVTARARASWTGDSLTVTFRRTFDTPTGQVALNLTEVYSRSGDLLIVERKEADSPAVKVVYRKGVPLDRRATAPPSRLPRTATGPIPRTADGKPDLQGYWTTRARGASDDIEPHPASYAIGASDGAVVDPPEGRLPVHPWVPAARDYRANRLYLDPEAHCFPAGVPRMMYGPMPYQIIYVPEHIVMLFDSRHVYRAIPTNTRTFPKDSLKLWMGNSYAYWEGDTLVIESASYNGKAWLDMAGNMVSDHLRVVERLWFTDANTLAYQATLTDPKVYTRPWTLELTAVRQTGPGMEILEGACHEGNLDVELLRRTSDAP